MGAATITNSDGARYAVSYDPRGPTLEERKQKLADELLLLDTEISSYEDQVFNKQNELDSQIEALNALIEDYIYRVNNGLDTDPPIDPAPVDDPDKAKPPDEGEVEPPNDEPGAMQNVASELLNRHNAIRAAAGLSPNLTIDSRLSQAAQVQALHMGSTQQSTHTGPGGSTPQQRIFAAGYPNTGGTGENCAAGQGDFGKLMEAWMNSPGHRANIVRPQWTNMGVGYTYRPNSTYRHYYVVTFGVP